MSQHIYLIRNENNPESDAVRVKARSFRAAVVDNLGHGVWQFVDGDKKQQRWQTFYGQQLADGSYSHSDIFIVKRV